MAGAVPFRVRYERSVTAAGVDQAARFEFPVGAGDRAGSKPEAFGQVSDGRQPGSYRKPPGADGSLDLRPHLQEGRIGVIAVDEDSQHGESLKSHVSSFKFGSEPGTRNYLSH